MSGKTDFLYERYRLGELSSEERRLLETEPDFRERMADLDESDRDILARYPAHLMAEAIERRAAGNGLGAVEDTVSRFRPVRYLAPLAAAAAIIAALVLAFPRADINPGNEAPEETLRPKGMDIPDQISEPEIVLYRDGPEGIEILSTGDDAREHDLIQVGYLSGGNWWGCILSVDGNGVVTRHWPMDGDSAVSLDKGGEILLPYSYELDDAPDFEAFALVWADAAFSLDDAEAAMASLSRNSPPPNVDFLNPGGKTGMTVITIRKKP